MKVVILFTFFYLLGNLIFTTWAEFGTPVWDNIFFVWQSVTYGSVIAWWSIYAIGQPKVRKLVRWPFMLSGIMFVWEIVSLVFNISINHEIGTMVMFTCFIGVTTYLAFLELI